MKIKINQCLTDRWYGDHMFQEFLADFDADSRYWSTQHGKVLKTDCVVVHEPVQKPADGWVSMADRKPRDDDFPLWLSGTKSMGVWFARDLPTSRAYVEITHWRKALVPDPPREPSVEERDSDAANLHCPKDPFCTFTDVQVRDAFLAGAAHARKESAK